MSSPAGRPVCIPARGVSPFVTFPLRSASGTNMSVGASDAVAAVAAIAAVANSAAAVVADGIAVGVAGCRCGGTDMTRGRGIFKTFKIAKRSPASSFFHSIRRFQRKFGRA